MGPSWEPSAYNGRLSCGRLHSSIGETDVLIPPCKILRSGSADAGNRRLQFVERHGGGACR